MNKIISIGVLCYNSENFIIETLESIKRQLTTYKNIQLLIADDCSKDNSIEKINEWINSNKELFVDVKKIFSNINEGVTKRCQDILDNSIGEYLKLIAADDILIDNSILLNYKHAIKSKSKFVFSKMKHFHESNNNKIFTEVTPNNNQLGFFNLENNSQIKVLSREFFNIAPTGFLHIETLRKIGGFDLEFRSFEDYPLWFRISNNGYKLDFFNEVTVLYRRHNESLTSSTAEKVFNIALGNDYYNFYKKYRLPMLKKNKDILGIIHNEINHYIYRGVVRRGNTKKDYIIFYKVLNKLDPMNIIE